MTRARPGTRARRRPRAALAGALAATLLLAGCGSTYSPTRKPRPTVAAGHRVGAQSASECGDSLQSYAPAAGPVPWRLDNLTVEVNTDAPPLSFRNQDGNFEGFEIDLARAVADHLYGERGHLRLIPVTDDEQLLPRLGSSRHLLIGQVPMSCTNWERATLSATYLTTSTSLLVRAGDPTTLAEPSLERLPYPSRRICTNAGTTQPNLEGALAAESPSQCLMWLQQGDVDLIVTETAQAAGLLKQDRTLRELARLPGTVNYGIAASRDDAEIQTGVNAALSQWIASGGWQQSYDRWLRADLGDGRPPQPSYGRTP